MLKVHSKFSNKKLAIFNNFRFLLNLIQDFHSRTYLTIKNNINIEFLIQSKIYIKLSYLVTFIKKFKYSIKMINY